MTGMTATAANGVTRTTGPLIPLVQLAAPPAAQPLTSTPRRDRPPGPAAEPRSRTSAAAFIRSLDGGTAIRLTAALAVGGVAAIAAVVSYSHIFDLAVGHHESGTAARLLPVSVDGLIVAASMTLLDAARRRLDAPFMAYGMLWLGVGATVSANVAFGLPWGWQSAVVAAWPAVAFVGSVEMALTLARNQRRPPGDGRRGWRPWRRPRMAPGAADGIPAAAAEAAPRQPASPVTGTPPAPPGTATVASAAAAKDPPKRRDGKPGRHAATARPPSDGSRLAAARAALEKAPGLTVAELVTAAGVSESTARRAKNEQHGG